MPRKLVPDEIMNYGDPEAPAPKQVEAQQPYRPADERPKNGYDVGNIPEPEHKTGIWESLGYAAREVAKKLGGK